MARHDQDFWSPGDQSVRSTDEVPRWLTLLGLCGGVALTIVLLRYAIDLLGLVFVIVVVGFSIRALTDWLTDAESISLWSIAAVCIGLVGTVLVATWLFGSRATRAGGVDFPLPTFMSETIAWAEAKGWGNRVLLSGAERGERGERAPRGSRQPLDLHPSSADQDASSAPRRIPESNPAREPSTSDPPERFVPGTTIVTFTTLSVTPSNRAPLGQPVRLTATVETQQADGAPDGTVVFWRDGVVLGSAPLHSVDHHAVAQLTTRDLPAGEVGLSAEYVGTRHFRTSRSSVVQQIMVEP